MKQQFKQFKHLHNHSDFKQEPLPLTQMQANSTSVRSHEALPLHYQLEAGKGLLSGRGRIYTLLYKILSSLPRPIQLLVIAILNRANDPKPEGYSSDQRKDGIKNTSWGWLPLLTLISALGMLSIAYAFIDSRAGGTGLRAFVYPGLFLIFAPTGLRLLSPSASRTERIGLLCVAGCCCYFIKVMGSPLYFSFYDEFLHWRTANDIVKSGHLFTENALLPVSPYYPGLEIVTNALGTISGLDTFNAGLIVVGIARLLMMLTLFALNEQVLRSARMASIATLLYMTNPHFLLFDSQFAYESLALPLATFTMFAMAPHQWVSVRLARLGPMTPFVKFAKVSHKGLRSDLRWITFSAWLVLIAVVLTHHVTDFILDALLVLWAIIYALLRLTPIHQSKLARTALLGVLISMVWIGLKGNPVVGYISLFLGNVFNELGHVLAGTSSSRQLFATNGGPPTLLWERIMAILSVVLILLCLPFGLLCLWQRYRSNAFGITLGVASLFYPISQVFRFTNSGSDLTDRAAAFLFIPIASVLAIFITHFWPTQRLNWKNTSLITGAMLVLFLGEFVVGSGPGLSLLPGPYELGDPRVVEIEGIQAATWADLHLGPNNRIGTDRNNQVLMGTFGDQRIVTSIADGIDISPTFFSARLGAGELSLLRDAQVRYLVVDIRLTQRLPLEGVYFEEGELNGFHHTTPMDLGAMTKFNTIPQINRVFDSGNIVIYDIRGLINAPEKS